jgi:hypothetical protein
MAGPTGDLPLRPREMRDRNRALVLDAVARHQPVTRAQLAARTGLTKSSVSSIVGELLAGRVPSALGQVLVENEANVAALGELWFGDGAALGDYVHISGEVGVGAGIVVGDPPGGRARPGRLDQHRAGRRPGQRPGRAPRGRRPAGPCRPRAGRPQPGGGHGLAGQAGRPRQRGPGRDLRRARPLAGGLVPAGPAGRHPHDQGRAAADRHLRPWPGRGRPRRRRLVTAGMLARPGALLSASARA